MNVAEFEKVSFWQFKKDCDELGVHYEDEKLLHELYDSIQLPKRSTKHSAGYDFFIPFGRVTFVPDQQRIIPTGIRCKMKDSWVLMLFPRSSLGFKHGFALSNTTGIIDADYYNAANEGHIMVAASTSKMLKLQHGERFVQGLFVPYALAEEEEVSTERVGGLGSTGK